MRLDKRRNEVYSSRVGIVYYLPHSALGSSIAILYCGWKTRPTLALLILGRSELRLRGYTGVIEK